MVDREMVQIVKKGKYFYFNSSKNTWPFRYCIVVYLYCVDVSTKFLVLIKTKYVAGKATYFYSN